MSTLLFFTPEAAERVPVGVPPAKPRGGLVVVGDPEAADDLELAAIEPNALTCVGSGIAEGGAGDVESDTDESLIDPNWTLGVCLCEDGGPVKSGDDGM